MRRLVILALILTVLYCCGPKQEKVERYMEDGVEIIVNHLEPYKIKGEPTSLHLEEEFTIDMERDEIAEIGLSYVMHFDVDSEGSIYFVSWKTQKDFIFKFDKNGNFVTSFGRKGQGPGEANNPNFERVNNLDEISVTDPATKFLIFNKEGKLKKEFIIDSNIREVMPLETGNYLVKKILVQQKNKYLQIFLCLYNSQFEEIKKFEGYKIINEYRLDKVKRPRNFVNWRITKKRIFIGNTEKGYEFMIYDLEGNLLRKIRKEYKAVEVSEEVKKLYKGAETNPKWAYYGRRVYFSKHMPPFQYLFTDDEGRLFVMTYEKGKNPREYMYDIFNPDGIFIGRMSLGNIEIWRESGLALEYPLDAIIRNNHLYCFKEKDNGYRELVVYRLRWE